MPDAKPDDSKTIADVADFSKFAFQSASKSWRAVLEAETTLAVGTVDAWTKSATAWSRAWQSSVKTPGDLASSAQTTVDFGALTNASVEIAKEWLTNVTSAWRDATTSFVKVLEEKSTAG